MTNLHEAKHPYKPTCDSCRFRKVKCDRGYPCNACLANDLVCQYRHTPRRRGPQKGVGRRISHLKQGLKDAESCRFDSSTPNAVVARSESGHGNSGHQPYDVQVASCSVDGMVPHPDVVSMLYLPEDIVPPNTSLKPNSCPGGFLPISKSSGNTCFPLYPR